MAGLVPAIPILGARSCLGNREARLKAGHDERKGVARIAKAQSGDWQARGRWAKTTTMTAIVLGFAAAAFLGAGLVLTQFGLRYIHPLSGAAISVPSFTLVFLLLSPVLLRGETIVWHAVPIFVAVGLVFPA